MRGCGSREICPLAYAQRNVMFSDSQTLLLEVLR